jgi:hypothetical protein
MVVSKIVFSFKLYSFFLLIGGHMELINTLCWDVVPTGRCLTRIYNTICWIWWINE